MENPSASRIMEVVCTELCLTYSASTYTHRGLRRGRWDYILKYYHHIRNLVLGSQWLMARAPIQLAEINQRTLSQWYTATLREKEGLLLAPGPGAAAGAHQAPAPPPPPPPPPAPVLVHRVGPPAAAPVVVRTGQAAPGKQPLLPKSPTLLLYFILAAPPAAAAGPLPRATEPLPGLSLPQQRVRQLPVPPPLLALSPTLPSRQRPLPSAALPARSPPAAAQPPPTPTREAPRCTQCGQPRRKETGHFRHGRTYVCSRRDDWQREKQEKNPG